MQIGHSTAYRVNDATFATYFRASNLAYSSDGADLKYFRSAGHNQPSIWCSSEK